MRPNITITIPTPYLPIDEYCRITGTPNNRNSQNRSYPQRALRASQHDKINLPQTQIALHRTRLRFLDRRNCSILFFYKPDGQTAPVLAALR